MVTKYQNTKSRAVGIPNEVFVGLESKTAGRPVEMAALCIQNKERKEADGIHQHRRPSKSEMERERISDSLFLESSQFTSP